MSLFFWILVLLSSIWATHWGADQLAEPFQKLCQQWGLNQATGATLVALATASPEIGTNIASALQGVSDIGLGNLLGSNIISIPVIVTVAYIAGSTKKYPQENQSAPVLSLKPQSLTVQAFPYLIILGLVALLTIPEPWRGLQPIDGWIMLVAYLIYLSHALNSQSKTSQQMSWNSQEIILSIAGIIILVIGAYLIVRSTENIVAILGISQLVGGLFITSTLSVIPEVFATWSLAKNGQVTAATTSVIADNTATMTLAFFPLAWVNLPVQDLEFYILNLTFVGLLGAAYAGFLKWGAPENSFSLKEIFGLNLIYLIYLTTIRFIFWDFIR